MGSRTRRHSRLGLLVAAAVLACAFGLQSAGAETRVGTTCFGQPVTIAGTDGDDSLNGTPGNDVIAGGAGTDIILAGDGNDLICGEDGTDYIFGLGGNDSIDGGPEGDGFAGGAGDDHTIGGDGNDFLSFLGAVGPVTASLATGTATGEGNDRLETTEALQGGPFDDSLTGDDAFFNALSGGLGNDVLDGGGGFDGALYSTGPIQASLRDGTATGAEGNDTLRNIEGLEGTPGDDTFVGSDQTNVLDGRNGADVLQGLGGADLLQGDAPIDDKPGNDRLDGGGGDDFLQPSRGADVLDGGEGRRDLVDLSPAPNGVTANLGTGTASGYGSPRFVRLEGFLGSAFADRLTGDGGPNIMLGAAGVDRLFGAAGDDFLNGGDGADAFDGGAGIDYCLDGRGKGCEFSGLPGSTPVVARIHSASLAGLDVAAWTMFGLRSRPVFSPYVPLRVSVIGENSELGDAACAGSTAERSARGIASVTVKRRTSAGPPHKAPAPKYTKPASVDSPFVPDWLAAATFTDGTAAEGNLTWRGTLFRYVPKTRAWRSYKRTVTAVGSVSPTGAVVWTTASGAPLSQVTFSVPKGLFAWKAELQVPGETLRNDWIEPHADYARKGGVFAPACSFAR
jgi:Ca2+-binding RTX toxin-like protein